MFKWLFRWKNKRTVINNFEYLLENDDPYRLATDTPLERYIMYIKDQILFLQADPSNLQNLVISKEFSLLYLDVCIKEDSHKIHKCIGRKTRKKIRNLILHRTTLIDAYNKIVQILI